MGSGYQCLVFVIFSPGGALKNLPPYNNVSTSLKTGSSITKLGMETRNYCQTQGVGISLGVDFVFPQSQQEKQPQEPPPKSTRRK